MVNLLSVLEQKKQALRDQGKGAIVDAHVHCAHHRPEIEASSVAGCFYCCTTFSPAEIEDWVDDYTCALCPRCGIDSVVGDASGFPASDQAFLQEMNRFWFS